MKNSAIKKIKRPFSNKQEAFSDIFCKTKKACWLLCVLLALFSIAACKTTAKKTVDKGLIYSELGEAFAADLTKTLHSNKDTKNEGSDGIDNITPVYLAMLSPVNDTTEIIPLEVIEESLIRSLIPQKVYAIRREGRADTLEEVKLAMAGLIDSGISVGTLISPQYFLRLRVDQEATLVHGKKTKTVELFFSLELRDAKTQVIVYSGRKSLKRVVKVNKGSSFAW